MGQMKEYECPMCGGGLEFNSAIQKLKCPYCDSEFDMTEMEQTEEGVKTEQEDGMQRSLQEIHSSGTWIQEIAGMQENRMESKYMPVSPVAERLLQMQQWLLQNVHSAITQSF